MRGHIGVNPGELGSRLTEFGMGVVGCRGDLNKILLYLLKYRNIT